jgi:hypothetical protein
MIGFLAAEGAAQPCDGHQPRLILGLDNPAEWDALTRIGAAIEEAAALADLFPLDQGTAGPRFALIGAAGLLRLARERAAAQIPATLPPKMLGRAFMAAAASDYPTDELLVFADRMEAMAAEAPGTALADGLRKAAGQARAAATACSDLPQGEGA